MSLWTDFVKEYAAKNNLTYKQAMSDPRCSALYKEAKAGADKKAPPPTAKEFNAYIAELQKKEAKAKELYLKYAPIVNAPPEPEPDKKKEQPKIKRVKDIVKRKFDGEVYYANRFLDYVDAYGVKNGKVMMIGTVGDYNSLDLFDEPKSVSKNVRFYNDDIPNKPIKFLNDLQEKR